MESILDEGDLLDRFYKSDFFKKKEYKCKNTAKEGLECAIDKYLEQENVDGVGSVYRPTIEIHENALDSVDLEAIQNSFKAN